MVSGINIAGYEIPLRRAPGDACAQREVDVSRKIISLFGPDGLKQGREFLDEFASITDEVNECSSAFPMSAKFFFFRNVLILLVGRLL